MQRYKNYGNDVFYGFLFIFVTLDFFVCCSTFFAPTVPHHVSSLTLSQSRGYFNQCLVDFKRGIKDYLYILDKGEFDAEIDPFLSGKKSQGDFPICLEQHCNIWPCQQRLRPQSEGKKKQTNMSSFFLESQTLCRFNKKFHINPQSVFFFSVIEISEYKEIQNRSLW